MPKGMFLVRLGRELRHRRRVVNELKAHGDTAGADLALNQLIRLQAKANRLFN